MNAIADMETPMETTETFALGGRVRCLQPARGYRTAVDAVLVAAAVPALAGERVLDVGTGVGASAFCLAARVDGVQVVGLELQPALAALADQGIEMNGFKGRVSVVSGDLLEPPPELADAAFDHIMTNPPYAPAGTGRPSPDPMKATAMVEGRARLADWIRFCVDAVKPGGSITMIHRADRQDEVVDGFTREHCRTQEVLPVVPKSGRAAKRVIVRARKAADEDITIHPALVLHVDEDGDGGHRAGYTAAAEAVLRDAQSLL